VLIQTDLIEHVLVQQQPIVYSTIIKDCFIIQNNYGVNLNIMYCDSQDTPVCSYIQLCSWTFWYWRIL